MDGKVLIIDIQARREGIAGMEEAYVKIVLKQPAINEWMDAGKAESEVIVEDEFDAEILEV